MSEQTKPDLPTPQDAGMPGMPTTAVWEGARYRAAIRSLAEWFDAAIAIAASAEHGPPTSGVRVEVWKARAKVLHAVERLLGTDPYMLLTNAVADNARLRRELNRLGELTEKAEDPALIPPGISTDLLIQRLRNLASSDERDFYRVAADRLEALWHSETQALQQLHADRGQLEAEQQEIRSLLGIPASQSLVDGIAKWVGGLPAELRP